MATGGIGRSIQVPCLSINGARSVVTPENTRKASSGIGASIAAMAGSLKYSVPVAQTPKPTVPTQCGTPVVWRRKIEISFSWPAK